MRSPVHHGGLASVLRDALDSIELAFCKLAKIQYSAPWDSRRRGC